MFVLVPILKKNKKFNIQYTGNVLNYKFQYIGKFALLLKLATKRLYVGRGEK